MDLGRSIFFVQFFLSIFLQCQSKLTRTVISSDSMVSHPDVTPDENIANHERKFLLVQINDEDIARLHLIHDDSLSKGIHFNINS